MMLWWEIQMKKIDIRILFIEDMFTGSQQVQEQSQVEESSLAVFEENQRYISNDLDQTFDSIIVNNEKVPFQDYFEGLLRQKRAQNDILRHQLGLVREELAQAKEELAQVKEELVKVKEQLATAQSDKWRYLKQLGKVTLKKEGRTVPYFTRFKNRVLGRR